MVSGRLGTMSRIEFFFIKHDCMSMDSIIEVFYHLNKMLKKPPNTLRIIILSFNKTAHWHILHATLSKPLNFTFSDL